MEFFARAILSARTPTGPLSGPHGRLEITASDFFNKAYLIAPTTGCVHAVSNSSATLPFTLAFEEITRART